MKRTASSSASGSSSGKRSGLTELRHGKSYVSQRGLEEKLEHVRRHGVPDATSSRSQRRARHHDAGVMTRHGPLTHELMLPLAPPHGDTAITVCNPLAMLHEACLCEGFAVVFRAAHSARPSSYDDPWNILVYNDEIAHNPFQSGEDTRKCHAVYWTLVELGDEAMCSEDGWFTVAAVRSTLIKHLDGNTSHMHKLLLKHLFLTVRRATIFARGSSSTSTTATSCSSLQPSCASSVTGTL